MSMSTAHQCPDLAPIHRSIVRIALVSETFLFCSAIARRTRTTAAAALGLTPQTSPRWRPLTPVEQVQNWLINYGLPVGIALVVIAATAFIGLRRRRAGSKV